MNNERAIAVGKYIMSWGVTLTGFTFVLMIAYLLFTQPIFFSCEGGTSYFCKGYNNGDLDMIIMFGFANMVCVYMMIIAFFFLNKCRGFVQQILF